MVHRLVALSFLGPATIPDATVNHKNLVKTDNVKDNLEWMSRGDNVRHGYANGHGPRGAAVWNNKADPAEVRRMFENGHSCTSIAEMLGVTKNAISQMRKRYKKSGEWPADLGTSPSWMSRK